MTKETLKDILNKQICHTDLTPSTLKRKLCNGIDVYYLQGKNVTESSFDSNCRKINAKTNHDFIVITQNNIRAGIILPYKGITGQPIDINCVMLPQYRGKQIMSSVFKCGIINELWPSLCRLTTYHCPGTSEYKVSKHLAELLSLPIRYSSEIIVNEEILERILKQDINSQDLVEPCFIISNINVYCVRGKLVNLLQKENNKEIVCTRDFIVIQQNAINVGIIFIQKYEGEDPCDLFCFTLKPYRKQGLMGSVCRSQIIKTLYPTISDATTPHAPSTNDYLIDEKLAKWLSVSLCYIK